MVFELKLNPVATGWALSRLAEMLKLLLVISIIPTSTNAKVIISYFRDFHFQAKI